LFRLEPWSWIASYGLLCELFGFKVMFGLEYVYVYTQINI